MNEPLIQWETPEHIDYVRSTDWYWSVGIITVTIAALAFIFDNPIFGVLIIVSAFALVIKAIRTPHTFVCTINDRGIIINDTLYPFLNLESFWVDTLHHTPKLVLKSQKLAMPYIIIPLLNVDPDDVRNILLNYIAEVNHPEPLSHKIFDWLGF